MAQLIHADGAITPVQIPISLENMQTLVGGYIEYVACKDPNLVMYVNEEGLLKNLPENPTASAYTHHLLVGDCLLMTVYENHENDREGE